MSLFTDAVEEKAFVQEREEARVTHIDATKHRKSIVKAVAEVKITFVDLIRLQIQIANFVAICVLRSSGVVFHPSHYKEDLNNHLN